MTIQANAVAAIPADVVEKCISVHGVALTWGRWFIILAFFAALAFTAGEVLKLLGTRSSGGAEADLTTAAWLDSLKGVLQALKDLPNWVAIFLAGLALLWIARESPDTCTAVGYTKDSKAEAPGQTNREANQQ